MFLAAAWPCRSATTQCSIRIVAPLCGSGQRAMSPAAKMSGALVCRYWSTTTPRSSSRPARSASSTLGFTPIPATTTSASSDFPLFSTIRFCSIAAAVSSRWNLTPCRIDPGDLGAQLKIDPGIAVEFRRTQRDPVLRRIAGEIILGQIRPVAWGSLIGAEHRQPAVEPLPAQHFGRREPRGAAADDDDVSGLHCRSSALRLRALDLLARKHLCVALLDPPARHWIERGRAERLAGAQAEAGVVPRAAHGLAD